MARFVYCFVLLLACATAQDPEAKPVSKPDAKTDSAANPNIPTKVEGKPNYTISGTQYWDLKVGSGKKAIPGFTLRVNYIGWYKKNKTESVIFDSSRVKGPFQFDLGMRQVIKGWDEAIPGMRVGGKRQLLIPAEAAYGREGSGKIPPNTPLIFEIELVDVR